MPNRTLGRALAFMRRHGIRATANEIVHRISRHLESGGMPSAIHIEVSNCCNLHCEYCVLDEGAEGDRVMSDETFASLLPSLRHARRIDLSGLAEPLMNKRFPSMLARVREVAPHAHLTLCTNATLLTERIAEQLVDQRLDELVFSLDGVDPEAVDVVRKGGSLDDVVRNIRMLQDVKTRRGASVPVVSATVVLRPDNLRALPGIVRLAADLGAEAVNVNGLEPYSEEMVDQALWHGRASGETLSALAESVPAAEQAAHAAGLELRLPALSPQAPACPQVFRPIVLADGTVVPCSVLAYRRPAMLHVAEELRAAEVAGTIDRLAFGNARTDGLKAIWTGAAYREFRRRVKKGDYPAGCDSCLLKHGVICPTPPLNAERSLASASPESQRCA